MSSTGPAAVDNGWLDLTGVPGIKTVKRSPLYGTSPLPVVAAVLGAELGRPLAGVVAGVPDPLVVFAQPAASSSPKPTVSATARRLAVIGRRYG
jgi:hypothetical protein